MLFFFLNWKGMNNRGDEWIIYFGNKCPAESKEILEKSRWKKNVSWHDRFYEETAKIGGKKRHGSFFEGRNVNDTIKLSKETRFPKIFTQFKVVTCFTLKGKKKGKKLNKWFNNLLTTFHRSLTTWPGCNKSSLVIVMLLFWSVLSSPTCLNTNLPGWLGCLFGKLKRKGNPLASETKSLPWHTRCYKARARARTAYRGASSCIFRVSLCFSESIVTHTGNLVNTVKSSLT